MCVGGGAAVSGNNNHIDYCNFSEKIGLIIMWGFFFCRKFFFQVGTFIVIFLLFQFFL